MNVRMYVVFICSVATLGGLLFGYDTAVISGTTEFIQAKFALSDMLLGWVVSSALGGCIVGTLFSGWFGDRYGRRAGLLLAAGRGRVAPGLARAEMVERLLAEGVKNDAFDRYDYQPIPVGDR